MKRKLEVIGDDGSRVQGRGTSVENNAMLAGLGGLPEEPTISLGVAVVLSRFQFRTETSPAPQLVSWRPT